MPYQRSIPNQLETSEIKQNAENNEPSTRVTVAQPLIFKITFKNIKTEPLLKQYHLGLYG